MSKTWCLVLVFAGCGDNAMVDAMVDATVDATVETPRDALEPGAEVTLRNPTAACDADPYTWYVFPYPSDVGHWATSRLTPTGAFSVDAVSYQLRDQNAIGCDAAVGHHVRVFTGRDISPPGSPEVLFEQTIQLPPGDGPIRTVDLVIDPPIVVDAGRQLFVAIEMQGVAPSRTCIKYCKMGGVSDDHDYLSNEAVAPFTWSSLRGTSADSMTLDVRAHGHALH